MYFDFFAFFLGVSALLNGNPVICGGMSLSTSRAKYMMYQDQSWKTLTSTMKTPRAGPGAVQISPTDFWITGKFLY